MIGEGAKISVLIPCYNAARFVRAALESVFAQTWPKIELVVVDDGSTDGSLDILRRYEATGAKIISQDNRGAAAARNRAFLSSSGDFVLYFDADDLMGPRHLESLMGAAAKSPGAVGISPWARFERQPDDAVLEQREHYRDMSGAAWLAADWRYARPMTQSGMILLPRELVLRVGGWNESLSLIDDFEFYARAISKSLGVRYAPEGRLYYRSAVSGSLSSQHDRAAIVSAYHSLMMGTDHLLEVDNSVDARAASATVLQNFEFTHFPWHPRLRASIRRKVAELGGSDLQPLGPPGFQRLRRIIGWRAARLSQMSGAFINTKIQR